MKNPPANAGDTGSIPGLGRSYIPPHSRVHVPPTAGAHTPTPKSSPCSSKLEKASPRAAKDPVQPKMIDTF